MANTAARLVDRVLPDVPVRQYVLSLPFELRALVAFKPEELRAMARLFVESIFGLYRTRARRMGSWAASAERSPFVQRFGGSLNLNVNMDAREGRAKARVAPPTTSPPHPPSSKPRPASSRAPPTSAVTPRRASTGRRRCPPMPSATAEMMHELPTHRRE